MPTPGYVFKDGQPIPDSDAPNQPHEIGSEIQPKEIVSDNTTTSSQQAADSPAIASPSKLSYGIDAPTESHALAFGHDAEIKGAAQEHHFESEVKDLGWNDHPDNVPKPLVGGLQNEDLWLLVRRFNRVSVSLHASCFMLNFGSKYIMSELPRSNLLADWIL